MKKQNGLSVGTILFLSLVSGIIALTLLFLFFISGSDFQLQGKHEAEELKQGEEILQTDWIEKTEVSQIEVQNDETEKKTEPSMNPVRIVMSFAGDITLPKTVQDTMMINSREYDFMPVFKGISEAFKGADLSVATLETLINNLVPYETYNAPPALLETLKEVGIHHLNLATEHMLDLGFDGLKATKLEVNRFGMEYSGYLSQQGTDGMISVNGVRIAILAYTYGLSDEGRAMAGKSELSDIPIFSVQKALDSIRMARANGADLVIVLPHWGTKNVGTVTDAMRDTANQMAEAGADLIIGAHSNVVSEAGFIQTKRADGRTYETLVCYSLGALLTDARSEDNAAGMILNVEVEYNPATRQNRILSCRPIPLYIYQDSINDRRTWRVLNVLDEEQVSQVSETVRAGAGVAMERVRAETKEIET